MINLTIQCPSCGRNLVHGEKLLSRLEGRRGATRCPCCRDRIHFDATGPALRVTFPDLHADNGAASLRFITKETANPPEVIEASPQEAVDGPEVGDRSSRIISRETFSPPEIAEDRTSRIVTKDGRTISDIPRQALKDAPLPSGSWFDLTPTGDLALAEAQEEDLVLPLVQRKQA